MDYYVRANALPNGPLNTSEFEHWPSRHVECMLAGNGGAVFKNRIESLYENGLLIHSDFSGKLSPETVFRLHQVAFREFAFRLPHEWVKSWRGSDISPVALMMMKHGRTGCCPKHVWPGIEMKLPDATLRFFDDNRPYDKRRGIAKGKLTPEQRREHRDAYKAMDKHLAANRNSLFGFDKRSINCMAPGHYGKNCKVASSKFASESDSDSSGEEEWRPRRGAGQPLTMLVAGSMCTPFTSFGACLGAADPAMEPWYVFINDAATTGYDVVHLENSSKMPIEMFREPMPRHYRMVSIILSQHLLGWPSVRERLFATALNTNTIVWVGPADDDEIRRDFLSFFEARVMREADVFAGIDSVENERQVHRELWKTKGVWPRPGEFLPLKRIIRTAQVPRFEFFEDMYMGGIRNGYLEGAFTGDISQNPRVVKRCGPWMPALQQSSQMVSFSARPGGYLFTPNEINATMGWPSLSQDRRFRECMHFDFERF
jgi:hypothetical protein